MQVVSVTESQQVDQAGQLTDVYEITFTITDRPGSFTVLVDKHAPDVVQAARDAIDAVLGQVQGIYGL